MYPVSELYKSKIKELERTFEARIQIQHSQGVLNLTDADIVGGSLTYNESSQAGEDFTIGGTVASDIEFSILNKPEYADIEFMGATALVYIGLELIEGMNLTYEDLKQYTYGELKQFSYGQLGNDVWEYVPLGIFNIDDIDKQRNSIKIKAIDNMIKLDKPYSLSSLGYPATLFQIYVDACNVCDIMPAMGSFTNSNYVVQEHPGDDLTFRDIIGHIAELSGAFARINRAGALEFAWYTETGLTLTSANRFNFIPRDDLVQIKGVMATVDDTTYLAGTDEYAIDLSENPLLQGDHETILPVIYDKIKNVAFYPFESSWQGNPAIQAGDIIKQIDRDSKEWPTIVTSSTYKYRGASTLAAKGLPIIAKGFKGSTNRKIAEIKRKIEKDIGDQLTTLEQAQLHNTELIANMLGGYVIDEEGALYIADNPDLNLAAKVWKWGLGGFGYSSTGKDGPYTTAITADGSIVAMLVAAGIVTADMVQTGELRSVDGSTRINLDDGSFNFKNVLRWANQILSITGLNGVELSSNLGVKATHSETGEYTQLNAAGLKRFVPIPIYAEVPTGVPNVENFEGGVIPEGWETKSASIVSDIKYAGNYALKINYSETKNYARTFQVITKDNTEISFYYRINAGEDKPNFNFWLNDTQYSLIADGTWKHFTATVNRGIALFQWEITWAKDAASAAMYIDNIIFEQNPITRTITGYSEEGHDYAYRTYIGTASTAGSYLFSVWSGDKSDYIPDIWVQLPDDFKGKDFEVFLSIRSMTASSGYDVTVHHATLELVEKDVVRGRFRVRANQTGYFQDYVLESYDMYPSGQYYILRTAKARTIAGLHFTYFAIY